MHMHITQPHFVYDGQQQHHITHGSACNLAHITHGGCPHPIALHNAAPRWHVCLLFTHMCLCVVCLCCGVSVAYHCIAISRTDDARLDAGYYYYAIKHVAEFADYPKM